MQGSVARARCFPRSATRHYTTWYQPLRWFSDEEGRRPEGHVRMPFSTRTLERGFIALRASGLVTVERTIKKPSGGRFSNVRSIYTNNFAKLDIEQQVISEVDA